MRTHTVREWGRESIKAATCHSVTLGNVRHPLERAPPCSSIHGGAPPLGLGLRTALWGRYFPSSQPAAVQAGQAPLARGSPSAKGNHSQQLEVKLDDTELVRTKAVVTSPALEKKSFCSEWFCKLDTESALDRKHDTCFLLITQ